MDRDPLILVRIRLVPNRNLFLYERYERAPDLQLEEYSIKKKKKDKIPQ